MKNLLNLGIVLNKKEQQSINGGEFCVFHCIDECFASLGIGASDEERNACATNCQRIGDSLGGGFL